MKPQLPAGAWQVPSLTIEVHPISLRCCCSVVRSIPFNPLSSPTCAPWLEAFGALSSTNPWTCRRCRRNRERKPWRCTKEIGMGGSQCRMMWGCKIMQVAASFERSANGLWSWKHVCLLRELLWQKQCFTIVSNFGHPHAFALAGILVISCDFQSQHLGHWGYIGDTSRMPCHSHPARTCALGSLGWGVPGWRRPHGSYEASQVTSCDFSARCLEKGSAKRVGMIPR